MAQAETTVSIGLPASRGAPEALAVDGNDLSVGLAKGVLCPGCERALEVAAVDGSEDAADGVVRGHTAVKRQEPAEPVEACLAEGLDGEEAVGAGGDGAEREAEDVGQRGGGCCGRGAGRGRGRSGLRAVA